MSFPFSPFKFIAFLAGFDVILPIILEKSLCFGYTFFKTAKLPLVYGRHIVVSRSAPPIFQVHGAGLFYIIPFRLLSFFYGSIQTDPHVLAQPRQRRPPQRRRLIT